MQDATTQAGAFALGLRAGYSVAAFVLFATALGFGAVSRDAGFSLSQDGVPVADDVCASQPGCSSISGARRHRCGGQLLAVTLAAVRLFPMVAVTMPTLRGSKSALFWGAGRALRRGDDMIEGTRACLPWRPTSPRPPSRYRRCRPAS